MKPRWLLVILVALAAAPPGFGQERKYLRWGGDQVGGGPFIFKEPGDKPVNPDDEFDEQNFRGFEIELARYLAKEIGRESEFVPGDWDKLPELLKQNVTDDKGIDIVLNGYELRDDLNKDTPATVPYYAYRLSLVVHKDAAGTIRKWSDLPAGVTEDGKTRKAKVGVLGATVAHQYLKDKYGDKIDLQINPDVATVMGLVETRRGMDATVQDSPAARFYAARSKVLQEVGDPVRPGYYVIYTRKEDKDLREKLNAAIKKGLKDGTLRKIYRKYDLWNADQDWLCKEVTGEFPDDEDEGTPAGAGETGKADWGVLLRELLKAAGMTVFLAVASFPIAMFLGMLVALGRVYGPALVRFPMGLYVEFLRGTPLLLQLYFVFYLLPPLVKQVFGIEFNFTPIQAGILGLAINYSAYEAENYRAGLLAVPRGQMEAALALGMNPLTALRVVVVPQAVRVVIPPVTNDFIALFKDTSVCSVILIVELTRKYNELYNFNREYIIQLAFLTAGMYLLMSYPLALVARVLERRLGSAGGGHR